ncbi:MAG: serine/threonine-protein kinase [Planctomycetota bacterium]|jgi:hypothetical protein
MPDVPAPDDLLAIAPEEFDALQAPAPAAAGPGLCAGLTVGPYRLEQCIGAGGMGEVYRAVRLDDDRPAAVKVLRGAPWLNGGGDGGGDALERFRREARIARAIDHPNVVGVRDVGEHNGTWWLGMDLISGRSLHAWVAANGPLPWRLALRAAAQAACGLQAAHDNCIVHRDVKPANLLVGPDGRVRLADFGIAWDPDAGARLTLTGQALGTPAFMSPEQCTGRPADARSDLYSLGATLFFCVTARAPFLSDAGHLTLFEQQVRHAAPRADRLNPGLPVAVGRVIAKCLSKPPSARYQSAAAFVADCTAILAGQAPALRDGDDTSVLYTRAFLESDVRDTAVERCIAEQEAASARGERPAPLGELLARTGAVAFRPSAQKVAARTDGALHCAECGTAAGGSEAWPPGPCTVCNGVLLTDTGVAVGEAFGRVCLVPGGTQARSAPACTADLLPLLGVAVQSGAPHVAVDCTPLGRLDAEHAVWIAEAVELVLAEGGSLALIVPDERARQLLTTVGVDQYARVVETRLALSTARPDAPAQDHTPAEPPNALATTPGE